MTSEKMKSAFTSCMAALVDWEPKVEPAELPEQMKDAKKGNFRIGGFHPRDGIAHLKYMCLTGIALVDEGRLDKANRWLGFVQGCLWMGGFNSINEMREWNRPEGETK
jgi:hypothetical protein